MDEKILSAITDDELRTVVRENVAGLEEMWNELKRWVRWGKNGHKNVRCRALESTVIPNAPSVLSNLGRHYDEIIPNLIIYNNCGDVDFGIDLFMHSDTEAMGVEVKKKLVEKGIVKHVRLLKKLRTHEHWLSIDNKPLYGCLAGISIEESAKKLALDAGIYVLEIKEDEKRLNAFAPEAGKVGGW